MNLYIKILFLSFSVCYLAQAMVKIKQQPIKTLEFEWESDSTNREKMQTVLRLILENKFDDAMALIQPGDGRINSQAGAIYPVMVVAVNSGNLKIVKGLLAANGFSVALCAHALKTAAGKGFLPCVILLSHLLFCRCSGTDFPFFIKAIREALVFARAPGVREFLDSFSLLASKGDRKKMSDDITNSRLLHAFIELADAANVNKYLVAGASLADEDGELPYTKALRLGHRHLALYISLFTTYKNVIFYWIKNGMRLGTIGFLVEKCPAFTHSEFVDEGGNTLLHLAARLGHDSLTGKVILANRSLIQMRNNEKDEKRLKSRLNPLEVALLYDRWDLVKSYCCVALPK